MPNMSYCRFENTLNDLRDCLNALQEEGFATIESVSEREAAVALYAVAAKFRKVYEQSLASEAQEKQDKLDDLASDAYSFAE